MPREPENPRFSLRELRETTAWQYVLRFLFGGGVAMLAHWVGHRYGTAAGGLFLAFPSLLPASLTLVNDHEGRMSARDDAKGAAVGSIGLAAFALVAWALGATTAYPITLVLSLVAWCAVSTGAWWLLLR